MKLMKSRLGGKMKHKQIQNHRDNLCGKRIEAARRKTEKNGKNEKKKTYLWYDNKIMMQN
jgi:hypothetical protein